MKGGGKMLLSNYDFYDIYSILVSIRFQPQGKDNIQIIQAVIDVLDAPQDKNIIEDNLIRKKARAIKELDNELFRFVFVDNIYTYGQKIIKDSFSYLFLSNGLKKILDCLTAKDYLQAQALADALHNVPILFADGCKNFKKTVKIQFREYNRIYKTDLMKELSK